MRNWGMDYESLRRDKDDIIYVSCSGFGQTGPTSHYRSYGSPSQAHAGLVHLAGLPGHPPAGWSFQIGDTHAGAANAITVLMAIHYWRRTGRGVFIDSAQTQNNVTLLGQYILEASANGQDVSADDFPPGNKRLQPRAAPHNAYPCLGEDKWCAIAVLSDDEWRRFVIALGQPAWSQVPDYTTADGRYANQEVIDGRIGSWTSEFDRYHVVQLLQGHGVRAGVVQDARDRLNWDRQLAHRGTYAIFDHPEVGPRRHETVGARLSRYPYRAGGAAPLMGEHNDYVFGDVLGLTADEIAQLEAKDVVRSLANSGEWNDD
jgi:crotonobetainyl-CoA:carnitine CoA-transferase CaiB-like acyl-CoA transferase